MEFQEDEVAIYAAALSDVPENSGKIALVHTGTRKTNDQQLRTWEHDWRSLGVLELPHLMPNPNAKTAWDRFLADEDTPSYRLPISMLDDYEATNELAYRIPRVPPAKYVTVVMTEANTVGDANVVGFRPGTSDFTAAEIERYPRQKLVAAVVTFSRVAFNPVHDLAIVGWDDLCGEALCGDGQLALFEKKGGAWHYARFLSTWDY